MTNVRFLDLHALVSINTGTSELEGSGILPVPMQDSQRAQKRDSSHGQALA